MSDKEKEAWLDFLLPIIGSLIIFGGLFYYLGSQPSVTDNLDKIVEDARKSGALPPQK